MMHVVTSGCLYGFDRHSTTTFAANHEQERLEKAGVVMQEIIGVGRDIPQEVIEKARCVIVFPSRA